MDHPIPSRRRDLVLINQEKRTCHLVDFAVPVDNRVKVKKRWKAEQKPGPCQRTENVVDHEGNGDANHSWSPSNGPKEPGEEIRWSKN